MTIRAVWVQLSVRDSLFWRWLLVRMALMVVPTLVCFRAGLGVLGLFLFALSAFIGPVRVTVDPTGLTLAGYLLRAHWANETIERVIYDEAETPPSWVRRPSLTIERKGKPPAHFFAAQAKLVELKRAARESGWAG